MVKNLLAFAPFLISSAVHCAGTLSMDKLEKRLASLEEHPYTYDYYNPAASLAYGIYFSADALYWQARESGTEYAIKNVLGSEFSQKNTFKDLTFDWDFGFRFAAGYTFPRDEWSLFAEWTHFFTKAGDRGTSFRPDSFIPIWANPAFAPGIIFPDAVKASWHLEFNEVDLKLTRPFKVSKYLTLSPTIGPCGLWIEQHYKLHYTQPSNAPNYSHVHLKNEFEAVGARAGLETRFGFRYGWSIFNDAALALYYGEFELKRKEKFYPALTPGISQHDVIKKTYRTVAPAAQMALGIRFDHQFSQRRIAVMIKLSYEYAIYFSQNQFLRMLDTDAGISFVQNQGDLTISGGTLSAGMIF